MRYLLPLLILFTVGSTHARQITFSTSNLAANYHVDAVCRDTTGVNSNTQVRMVGQKASYSCDSMFDEVVVDYNDVYYNNGHPHSDQWPRCTINGGTENITYNQIDICGHFSYLYLVISDNTPEDTEYGIQVSVQCLSL